MKNSKLSRLGIVAAVLAMGASGQDSSLDHFEKRIRPVLAAHCYACHSEAAVVPQGGLLLDSVRGIQKGSKSGAVIQPGDPEHSLLLRAIRHEDKALKMPPGNPLPSEVVADFEVWIRQGAPLPVEQATARKTPPVRWSLQRPQLLAPPGVRGQQWVRNDIDRFILSRLEINGLAPSPEAGKQTLIRRAAYDLTGLPPTAEEVEHFLRDASPLAYDRLIDRLLASPRYGERWGRHWLDVARYADSQTDAVNAGVRYAWSYTYRDWVIGALNEDLPYDQFVLYQLAADRVKNANPRHLAALGFLTLGRRIDKSYPETVDDRIDAVTRGFLGLTVSCARCHDHKYDPIPTKDYYSLYSILANIRQPEELPLLEKPGGTSARQALYQERLARIRKIEPAYRVRRHAELAAFFKTQTAEYLVAARDADGLSNPEIEELVRDRQLNLHVLARWRRYLEKSKEFDDPVFRLWHAAVVIPDFAAKWPGLRDSTNGNRLVDAEVAARPVTSLPDLAEAYAAALNKHNRAEPFGEQAAEQLRAVFRGSESPVDVPLDEFELICTQGDLNRLRVMRDRYNSMLVQAAYDGAEPRAMAVENVPDPVPSHVFIRGNPNNPGELVPPHFLSCLGGSDREPFKNGTGRLELAQATIDPENPLTARVIVNRVWMHHFGFGLVRSPSDFGFRGDPPTHPELLDYLAVKFVQSGWSLKKLHRFIMTSAVYQQASVDNEAFRKIDPENQLLWRMNRRRLDIESVRDSMLAAAGRLDLAAGGVPFSLTAQPSTSRRTVYGFIERGQIPSLLSTFDFASPDQHTPVRSITTVPQQALFFLNSPFVAEQARYLVARPEVGAAATPAAKIQQLYRFVYGRAPTARELNTGLKFVSQGGKRALPVTPAQHWHYGAGEYRAETGFVESFRPFPVFDSDQWQGGAALPAAGSGKAVLGAEGGEPGEQPNQAVILRWVSPVSGTFSVEGTLRHLRRAVRYGDGVRGRVVSSRHGELASWNVYGSSAETRLSGSEIEKGDTIDFVVDARLDPEGDAFRWAPVIKSGEQTWDAKNDFSGLAPEPLTVWERYAQVLFETNEFAFVD